MNRKFLTGALLAVVLMVAGSVPVMAQDEQPIGVWQKEIKIGLNILQSSYSENWNGGEKGSAVWTGNLDARFEKNFSQSANWRNTLKLAYGQTHNQERDAQGDLFWKRPDKSDDMIDFESMFRWKMSSGWDPFVALNFTSLFQDQNDAQGRDINLNPMTFKESAGISRIFMETEKRKLMTRAGVAFIQNSRKYFPADLPSLDTESESSNGIAAEWITEYMAIVLNDRVNWESKLTMSLPLSYSIKSDFEDGFTSVGELPEDIADYTSAVDVDWDNTFTTNITKAISVKLFVRWVYDKYDNTVAPVVDETGALVNEADVFRAIRKAGQFKQTLALGFGYTFN